ncbi:MAG: PKD domain-containing protein, partial [Candidatus Bathyarchaeota archaeon]|nr:PKD domain-containing protein [Candidatus Bathyarchaeota archaeon]
MRKRSITRFTALLLTYVLVFTLVMAYACVGKLSGSISIVASPTTITVGESTTISGSITPASVGETVTIWYRKTGKPWGILATVTTNETSHYSYIWTALVWGTYELKATWIGDTYAAESSIIIVDIEAPPVASFTYLPHTPTIGENITFDASASSDPDGTIESYAWDFDDGNTGTGVTTTHAYTTADTYDITLTVTDNDTLTDTTTSEITVYLQLQPPIASFIHSPTEPQANETVTFNASSSSDPDGTIVSYEWAFGDGTNGTSEIATHTYADNGTYVVILNVTDNNELSDTTSKEVRVGNRSPNATFTETAETVYRGEAITFDA